MRVGPLKRMTSAVAETISVENLIKGQAYGLGFDLVGITTLGPAETASRFEEWIANGYAGEMGYLARGAAKRRNSRLPFEGAISAIVVGLNYGGREATGPIARYARGFRLCTRWRSLGRNDERGRRTKVGMTKGC